MELKGTHTGVVIRGVAFPAGRSCGESGRGREGDVTGRGLRQEEPSLQGGGAFGGGARGAPARRDAGPSPPQALAPLSARRCSSVYNLPAEHSSLRKICHKDVCRCAEGEVMGTQRPGLPWWGGPRSPSSPPGCRLG